MLISESLTTTVRTKTAQIKRLHSFSGPGYGDSANFVAQYLKKGSSVEVYGSLSIETREKDGKTYTNVCINADRVGFYGFRTKEDKGGDTKKK